VAVRSGRKLQAQKTKNSSKKLLQVNNTNRDFGKYTQQPNSLIWNLTKNFVQFAKNPNKRATKIIYCCKNQIYVL
jgi:hypothetical protein